MPCCASVGGSESESRAHFRGKWGRGAGLDLVNPDMSKYSTAPLMSP